MWTRRREISAMKNKPRDTKASSWWDLTIEISSWCATLIALYFEIKNLVYLDLSHHITVSNTSSDSVRGLSRLQWYKYHLWIRHFSLFRMRSADRNVFSLRTSGDLRLSFLVWFSLRAKNTFKSSRRKLKKKFWISLFWWSFDVSTDRN